MASGINFVRVYDAYGVTWYEAIHNNRRLYMYNSADDNVPRTVLSFIENAGSIKHQHDKLFDRDEVIYKA